MEQHALQRYFADLMQQSYSASPSASNVMSILALLPSLSLSPDDPQQQPQQPQMYTTLGDMLQSAGQGGAAADSLDSGDEDSSSSDTAEDAEELLDPRTFCRRLKAVRVSLDKARARLGAANERAKQLSDTWQRVTALLRELGPWDDDHAVMAAVKQQLDTQVAALQQDKLAARVARFARQHGAMVPVLRAIRDEFQCGDTDGTTCTICCKDPIQIALNPCGHTFCTDCVRRMDTRCFVCQRRPHGVLRIYL